MGGEASDRARAYSCKNLVGNLNSTNLLLYLNAEPFSLDLLQNQDIGCTLVAIRKYIATYEMYVGP